LLFAMTIQLPLGSYGRENEAGALRYKIAFATYLGGSKWDQTREVIVERGGSILVGSKQERNVYVVGVTASPEFRIGNRLVRSMHTGEIRD
jgi:hypothetical protein